MTLRQIPCKGFPDKLLWRQDLTGFHGCRDLSLFAVCPALTVSGPEQKNPSGLILLSGTTTAYPRLDTLSGL